MHLNRILILGDDHHNTLGVIRSLGEKEIIPDLIIKRADSYFITASRYLGKIYEIDSEQELLTCLDERVKQRADEQILICCSDWFISVIDRNRDRYKNRIFTFNAGKQGEVNRLMSKAVQQEYAQASGLNIPKTWIMSQGMHPPCDILYPCIVKTNSSIEGTKSDIVVCNNEQELINHTQKDVTYLVQEFIEKEYELNVLGCSVDGGKTCIIPGVIHKIREYPIGKGSSSFSVLSDFDNYPHLDVENIRKMINAMHYEGLFSVEFVCKGNNCYFLEVNFRNDGNGYIPTSSGINLHYIWVSSILKESLDIQKCSLPHYFMADVRDIFHVIKGKELSFRTWLTDFRRTDCFLLYNARDPKPFWLYCFNLIYQSLSNRWCGKKHIRLRNK